MRFPAIFLLAILVHPVSADPNDQGGRSRRASSHEKIPTSYLPPESSYNSNSSFNNWMTKALKDYDSRLRPNFGSKVMKITVRFYIIGISQISEKDMSFTVEMFFHETWTDTRLKYDVQELEGHNPLTLPPDAPELIWSPDTTFLNALSSTSPERGSVSHLYYMKLYANGTITQSRRISVTASCKMDLTMYPFDRQACKLELSSYGWTVNDIIYEWSKDKEWGLAHLTLQDYYVTRHVRKVTNLTFHAGSFSSPQLCIELHRRSGFYFLQLIVPATAVVASTWISLWLESETKFGDLVAVILAIIFLSYSYNTMMPKVSYVKAMDIYLVACFIFTFLSLVKLAVVKYLRQKVTKLKDLHKQQELHQHAQTAMIEELTGVNASAVVPALSLANLGADRLSRSLVGKHDLADLIVIEEEVVVDRIPICYNETISVHAEEEAKSIYRTIDRSPSGGDHRSLGRSESARSTATGGSCSTTRKRSEQQQARIDRTSPIDRYDPPTDQDPSTKIHHSFDPLITQSTTHSIDLQSLDLSPIDDYVPPIFTPSAQQQRPLIEYVIHAEPLQVITIDQRGRQESVVEIPRKKPTSPTAAETIDRSSEKRGAASKRSRRATARSMFKRRPPSSLSLNQHDKYWRWMKAFHVVSQLVLPLVFIAFGLFYFFVYPYFDRTGVCT